MSSSITTNSANSGPAPSAASPGTSVRIPANLRPLTNGDEVIHVEGNTVGDALLSLVRTFPPLHDRLRGPDGLIRRTLLVFLNDEDIRNCEGEETALREGDEISIVPALAGG